MAESIDGKRLVDMEPNPTPGPHHTTQRIAELNEVVAALAESNNNMVDNQGIHEVAIAELQRVIGPRTVHQESISDEIRELSQRISNLEGMLKTHLHNANGRAVLDTDDEWLELNADVATVEEVEPGWDSVERGKSLTSARLNGTTTPEENVYTPPQPTPPAAPDEEERWEMVGHHALIHPATAKAAVAKAAALGLVPTPRIEVTQSDVEAVHATLSGVVYRPTHRMISAILINFASRKNGGAR